MTNETIEKKTAKAVLQKPEHIAIGGESYEIAPPSIATLILMSEAISELPSTNIDRDMAFTECLAMAKDCRALGDILAILILGARNLETKKKLIKKRLFGLIRKEYEVTIDNKAILADKILSEMTPEEVSKVMTKALSGMQLAFFLALTTPKNGCVT